MVAVCNCGAYAAGIGSRSTTGDSNTYRRIISVTNFKVNGAEALYALEQVAEYITAAPCNTGAGVDIDLVGTCAQDIIAKGKNTCNSSI